MFISLFTSNFKEYYDKLRYKLKNIYFSKVIAANFFKMMYKSNKISILYQHLISFGAIISVSTICYLSTELIGYKIVALILLMTVSVIAMLFDILPVLLSAILSALIWNFFFIPPVFTFHIENLEDLTMFFQYFLIAMVHVVLTYKIRKSEQKVRDKEEEENTIKLYNTLFNSLSHELRTPIATIIGSIDTLKDTNVQLSKDNQNQLLTEIDSAAFRLNNQVENLLNISRLESGMLKLKNDWNDINDLINTVIEKINTTDHKHSIEFINNDILPLCNFDFGILEQVIYNILTNCIQYTPINSKILITTKFEHPNLVIEICDNGPGIPEHLVNQVFNKFYRIEHTKSGGTGLGLSIVKGFVDAYNGNITISNIKTGGAKFVIELPLEASFINNLKNE